MRISASSLMLWALVGVGAARQPPNQGLPPEIKAWFEPTEPLRIVVQLTRNGIGSTLNSCAGGQACTARGLGQF
jgi:hypothetical protein